MPPMRRGWQRIPSILEMHRNTEVKRRGSKEQMATYQRGNNNQEDTVKNVTEQRNLGTLAYNIKCEWKEQSNSLRKQNSG
jgi:hypothetical protein